MVLRLSALRHLPGLALMTVVVLTGFAISGSTEVVLELAVADLARRSLRQHADLVRLTRTQSRQWWYRPSCPWVHHSQRH